MSHSKNNILSLLILLYTLFSGQAFATNIAQSPLYLEEGVPPIVMITMGRDHKLYYEAYNDASDLNDDDVLDIRYKPTEIDYFGYFDSYKCYSYGSGKFTPVAAVVLNGSGDKVKPSNCNGQWSGDFLNYLTTSRMDALRKVLYGGSRSTDLESETILKRAYIPQDAHSWGKQYTSEDDYDITHYSSLPALTVGKRHLFSNTTLSDNGVPLLRVLENSDYYIWEWVSKENPVAGDTVQRITNGSSSLITITGIEDLQLYIDVCVAGKLEENCRAYSDGTDISYKPIGLLQRYGEDELMAFGLLTGSYTKNMSGGVLRKNIASFRNEIDMDTGMFDTSVSGIVDTIDKLRITGLIYNPDRSRGNKYGGSIVTELVSENDDTARNWGNPVAEMMYEGLRYFSEKNTATTAYSSGVAASGTVDSDLGLPLPAWQDPYRTTAGGFGHCAKPIQLVISDINPSYDTDQIPGTSFGSYIGDLTGLNVSTLADRIWAGESEATKVFIGQSGTVKDGTPSAKTVNSFKNIRGLTPEEPNKKGGYYAASIALFGKETDIHTTAAGEQNVDTIAVALASPLPKIEIPVNGQTVTIVPFAKSIRFLKNGVERISQTLGHFQPTNQIVDFYVHSVENIPTANENMNVNGGRPSINFSINFEDVEQGSDHDMDAMVEYKVEVNADNKVVVELTSTYARADIVQHIGYVISGTTVDGTYLEVRGQDTAAADDKDYFLDTPAGQLPGGGWNHMPTALPLTSSRIFEAGSGSAEAARFIKHDPLWYAAKWSMTDDNENGTLETAEWDADADGDPDGYFLVTNAGKLEKQLEKAFAEIQARTSTAAAVATNSTRLDANTKIYQARFNTANWDGELLAYAIEASGAVASTYAWKASEHIPSASTRKVYSYNPVSDDGIAFLNANLSTTQLAELNKDGSGTADSLAADRINYLRGDQSKEVKNSGGFRNRTSLLGDVINSDPWFVSSTGNFGYSQLSGSEGSTYLNFRINKSVRKPALYFGANDGMLHAVNANDGNEFFTYVPDAVISYLNKLTSQNYGCSDNGCIPHQYFVDGSPKAADAYIDVGNGNEWRTILVGTLGAGGKGLFALDVTNPDKDATTVVSGLANSSLSAFSESNVLWEISTTQPAQSPPVSTPPIQPTAAQSKHDTDLTQVQAYLGYTLGQASIVRMNNGKWAAIVANGYESNAQTAALFIIDLATGETMKMIDTGVGSSGSPNGLSEPIAIDNNGDMIVDSIYAGDLQGNLWKFDVTGAVGSWKVADVITGGNANDPLYVAKDVNGLRQPITAKPQVGFHPDGGQMVYFGTGKYYAVNDQIIASTPKVHTFYGIRDLGVQVGSRSSLQQQSIIYEAPKGTGINIRVVSDTQVDYTSKKGWYMDLVTPGSPDDIAKGERVVNAPLLRDGRIIFTTLIPTEDPCGWGGDSWLMELNAVNGNRLNMASFGGDVGFVMLDLDGDGSPEKVWTSGVNHEDLGIVNTPAVISLEDKTEKKYLAGTSGNVEVVDETASDPNGRQSWQQIR